MHRRLSAILAADMVGYSRLMGEDEMRTLAALSDLRSKLFEPVVEALGGEIIKRMGDGWFVAFPNASDAAACAIEIQEAVRDHDIIQLRIGIHIGDVIFQDEDIYGDGVNVAARLEALAEPGQVVISDMVHNSLDTKTAGQFEGGDAHALKNISREVRVWHWPGGSESNVATPLESGTTGLPRKPSIAVLPFSNLSSNPEQEFFADGVVEDLITALSRFPWLFVLSRNTSFSYKGEHVQAKQVAADLGVRYMVEGSLRMSPSRLRITVQLIDAVNDRHVWAENYDRPTGDLFDLQDEISQAITGVLVPALSIAERERFQRESHPSLDAWAAYQKGLTLYYKPYSDDNHKAARQLFDRSVELDPGFADAHAMIAMMGVYSIRSGQTSYTGTRDEILAEAHQAAELAVQLEDKNAMGHVALGIVKQIETDYKAAVSEAETALKLNPNLAIAHYELGFILFDGGRLEESVEHFDRAIRLSPNDPSRWNFFLLRGDALTLCGELERAIANYEEATRLRSSAFWPFMGLASAYARLGEMEKAKTAIAEVQARKPGWSIVKTAGVFGDASLAHVQILINSLRDAGLPEE